MAVVLTSTTSPQNELEHGVSEDWRNAEALKPAQTELPLEVKPDAEETTTEVQPAGEVDNDVDKGIPEKPKEQPKGHKSGWQKRIDKLTARNHMLEKENEEYRTWKAAQAEKKPEPQGPKEPKLADFNNNVEEFLNARDTWKENSERQSFEIERRKAAVDTYNEKISKARGEYDDWDEVVSGSKIIIPQAAVDAVVELDNGPDVAYYLAQHPDEAEKLMDLSPVRTIAAITKIADKIAGESAKPAPKAKIEPPTPITPVGASATRGNTPLDELSIREYIKIRNKQEREARRG